MQYFKNILKKIGIKKNNRINQTRDLHVLLTTNAINSKKNSNNPKKQ